MNIPKLPKPDPTSQHYSEQLMRIINKEIVNSGGKITFARYMELALYAPDCGYYNSGLAKLGKEGDFITAPEISPLFARCIAEQIVQISALVDNVSILEFGAGSGILALELLRALSEKDSLPDYYYILEISSDLKRRQQVLLQQHLPDFFSRIIWLEHLPVGSFNGIILANEVLDAMPVHKFRYSFRGAEEAYVTLLNNELTWVYDQPSSNELKTIIQKLQKDYFHTVNEYESEVNLCASNWIKKLSDILNLGLILVIDYGFPRSEYFHPQRYMGTLMCHYQHYAHTNPLILPGLQDITAHIDFTTLAEQADRNQLTIAGFTNQANFLLNCGLLSWLTAKNDLESLKFNSQIKLLTLPSEMGELFKVMALTRRIEQPLLGFEQFDKRQNL